MKFNSLTQKPSTQDEKQTNTWNFPTDPEGWMLAVKKASCVSEIAYSEVT
jgi:hypothetical protein